MSSTPSDDKSDLTELGESEQKTKLSTQTRLEEQKSAQFDDGGKSESQLTQRIQRQRRVDLRRGDSQSALDNLELPPVSQFKQQRQRERREDLQGEDPLWKQTYPRLESDPERRSVPDFLDSFHERLSAEYTTISGRVKAKRRVGGGLIFLDIVNEFRTVQVAVNKRKITQWKEKPKDFFGLFGLMVHVGDHISVTGWAGENKNGQPMLSCRELPRLVSPAMEQIPKTLTDPKTRMQERHVDMLVNKNVMDVLRLRSEITRYMRDHLHSKRFLEFQTPIMAENAGGAVARRFVTRATELRDKKIALRVAPELWLKRLVIGGVERVFEIGPAFRNEGVDATHNPEFTTCEFYSAYSNLEDLIKETEEIIHGLATRCQELIAKDLTSLPSLDLSRYVRPFKQVEFIPALEAAMGIRFPKLSSEDALPEMLAVLKLARFNIPGGTPPTLSKLLDRLAAVYLEPMSATEPIFIIHHPAIMSPLAKSFLCPKTYQMVSARAELFIGGREVANMYEEENDPVEQKRKMDAHGRLVNKSDGSVGMLEEPREKLAEDEDEELAPEGQKEIADEYWEDEESEEADDEAPLDAGYVRALDYGLPPTGGWGCGMERLVMVFSGANRISDCLSFGTLRNVVGLSAEDEKKASKKAQKQATRKEGSTPENPES